MPVYMIVDIQITDAETYARYVTHVQAVVTQHGGRYLARGGQITALSGAWHPERIVLIAFETIEQLHVCFSSPQYHALAPLREQSIIARSIIVQGCDLPDRPPHPLVMEKSQ